MHPASDSGGRFYPVSGIVYHGIFRCAGYIDGTDRRPFFFWRTVSAAAPCFHGISDYRSVGAFFLRVSLFLRNDAGAYFLFFQKDCLREGTDSETVGPHPEISEIRNIGPDNGWSLGTGAACGFFLESLGRVRDADLGKSFPCLLCHTHHGIRAAVGNRCGFPVCGALFLPVSVSPGALLAVVSGKRLYKIRRQGDSCTNCGLCTRACSMGIPIPEKEAVISVECIQCMQCLAICPKKSLSVNPSGAMAGTAAAAVIGGTVLVGNLDSFPAAEPVSEQAAMKTESAEKGKYKDSVYTGTGEGFRGKIEVQVTVEDGYLSDITVLSFQDDQSFFQKAQSAVIQAILTEQTTDVSAVSGATFSSKGIMDAVADALGTGFDGAEQPGQSNSETAENRDQSGAGESRPSGDHGAAPSDNSQEAQSPGDKPGDKGADTTGTTRPEPETQSPGNDDPGPSDNGQETDKADGRFSVPDGTYEGTGSGFRGTTTVSVTVKDNAITDITIQSYEDDTAFFTRAKDTIISEIISTQSLDVPTVSGATFSSNSILNAVADALGTGSPRAEQPADNESNSGTDQPEADGGNGQGQTGGGRRGNGWRGSGGSGDGQRGRGN